MGRNLGPLNIKDSYEGLVQISGSLLTDGSGSLISNLEVTASYATTADASISASYAQTSTSASHALVADVALNVPVTASYAVSASYAISSSHSDISDFAFTATSASYATIATLALSSSHANNSDTATSSSYAATSTSASFALTASFAENVTPINTGSFYLSSSVNNATITFTQGDGSTEAVTVNNVSNATSASYAVTASYALDSAPQVSASYATSASHANTATSASYATTASFALNVSTPNLQQVTDAGATTTNAITASGMFVNGNAIISGDLDVNGTITYISSSTLQIGDNVIEINYNKAAGNSGIITYDTTSPFTASLLWDATTDRWIAGPYGSEENIILAGDTGSMSVANAVSASYAVTASYAANVSTPDLQTVTTAGASTTNTITAQGNTTVDFYQTSLLSTNALTISSSVYPVVNIIANNPGLSPPELIFTDTTTQQGVIRSGINYGGGLNIQPVTGPLTISGNEVVSGSLQVTSGITGSLLGTASFATSASHAVASDTSISASYATTATSASYALSASYAPAADPFPYTGNVGITGDINLTGSYNRLSGSFSGSAIDNITDVYSSTAAVEHVISLTQAEYNAVSASADPTTLYYITDALSFVVSASYADFALSSSHAVNADSATSASYSITSTSASYASTATSASYVNLSSITQNVAFTGSVLGEVNALSIVSLQADIDCSVGNFFTLTLAAGVDTEIIFSNVQAGQTINLQITNNATTIGTVSFGGNVLFADGTAFTATATLDAIDVMTFVCFDGTNILATGINNFTP